MLRRSLALALAAAACSATLPALTGVAEKNPDASPPADAGPCSKDGGADAPDGGGAALAWLDVRSDAPGALPALLPAFSPDVFDYYVRCGPGTNLLEVKLGAKGDGLASIAVETPATPAARFGSASASEPTLSLEVRADEGQAIVASVDLGGAHAEYWIRCLPHDVSPMDWEANADAAAPTPGYYLLGNEQIDKENAAYAVVLDRNGVPVWYDRLPKTLPFEPTTSVLDVDSLVPGTISFIPWPSEQQVGPFEIRKLSPLATTHVGAPDWALDPHELRALSNGDFLLFTNQLETGVDLTGYDSPEPDGGVATFGSDASILPCTVLELDPSNRVVWEWKATDHLDPVKDNILPGLEVGPSGVLVPDPFHCNSIDVDPENGDLLVSARHLDSVFYIDRTTGKILWKMGGVDYTKDGARFLPVSDPFHLQHDARLAPGWSSSRGGHVTLFDDESYTHKPARALVYDVSLGDAPGATLAWEEEGTYPSSGEGSFRLLEDGSRVIGWGTGGVYGLVFTEVDADHNQLLGLTFTDGNASYRAVKVPLCSLDLGDMRRTAGLP